MSKHTPGEWYADDTLKVRAEKDNRPVAEVDLDACEWGISEANAQLIAAAPDLLSACKCLLETAFQKDVKTPDILQAEAAIRKATGGS